MVFSKLPLSDQVKYVRGKLLITQGELARRTGISLPTICRWEANKGTPQVMSLSRFYQFCHENGIDVREEVPAND